MVKWRGAHQTAPSEAGNQSVSEEMLIRLVERTRQYLHQGYSSVVSQALLSRHQRRCLWQPNFASFGEARTAITHWIGWHNAKRPHQTLGHCSPRQWRARYNPNSRLDIGVALQLRNTGLKSRVFQAFA
jgi:hypothetical protein